MYGLETPYSIRKKLNFITYKHLPLSNLQFCQA